MCPVPRVTFYNQYSYIVYYGSVIHLSNQHLVHFFLSISPLPFSYESEVSEWGPDPMEVELMTAEATSAAAAAGDAPPAAAPPETSAEAKPTEVTYWKPGEEWTKINDHLWCPISGRLIPRDRVFRHVKPGVAGKCTDPGSCPLQGRRFLQTYHRQVEELTCECGHRIRAIKGSFRKPAYEHLRQSIVHQTDNRNTTLNRLLGQQYLTVASDRATSEKFGVPLLGEPQVVPQLPPQLADVPRERQMLARSVAALGETVTNWSVDDALAVAPKYRDVLWNFLAEAGAATARDTRYVITDVDFLLAIKGRLEELYLVAVPTAQLSALVALVRRLERRLVSSRTG